METASLAWRTLCVWIKQKYGLQEIREIENLMQQSEKEHFPTFIQFLQAKTFFFTISKNNGKKKTLSAASLDGKFRNELMNLKCRLPCSHPVHSAVTGGFLLLLFFVRLFIASSLFSSPASPRRTISLWIFYTIQMNSVNWSAEHGRLPSEMFGRGV